jgi:hypothetical protein
MFIELLYNLLFLYKCTRMCHLMTEGSNGYRRPKYRDKSCRTVQSKYTRLLGYKVGWQIQTTRMLCRTCMNEESFMRAEHFSYLRHFR